MTTNTDQSHRRSSVNPDVIHLCILFVIALCVGLYLIYNTEVIAKDGVTFIEYARNFQYAPRQTMLDQDQHPAYPVMILALHNAAGFFTGNSSLFTWIHAAQASALIFRLLAIVVLYFLGKDLVGRRFSFWAVLIIVFLPLPARYGSDALSDWPHLFFLALALFLAIRAAVSRKLYLFALAGLAAGLGYLIRPECAQIVIYASLWLMLELLARKTPSWPRTVLALVLLLACFLIVAGPYMLLKADLLPKKDISIHDAGEFNRSETPQALVKLGGNIGDTLEWIFVPAWLVGLYASFRKPRLFNPQQFFIIVLVALNIILMIWLHNKFGYMDKRHTLTLVLFTMFYIPVGLETLASWLSKLRRTTGGNPQNRKQLIFYVLLALGIAVCLPQFSRPASPVDPLLRRSAQWLAGNTEQRELIAVSDPRIGFYAERTYIAYYRDTDSKAAKYVAIVMPTKSISSPEYKAPSRRRVLFSQQSQDSRFQLLVYGPKR